MSILRIKSKKWCFPIYSIPEFLSKINMDFLGRENAEKLKKAFQQVKIDEESRVQHIRSILLKDLPPLSFIKYPNSLYEYQKQAILLLKQPFWVPKRPL